MTLHEQLKSGLSHHQAGRLAEAETIYRQVLAQQPNHADALHLLGVLAGHAGRLNEAPDLIRRAIAICSTKAIYYSNLGKALTDTGQFDEAIAACRQAIRLKPGFAEAHYNLGNALKDKEQFSEAIASYRQAIRVQPDYAEAHGNLGIVLAEVGQLEEAIASYRQAIRLRPGLAEAHYNMGITLQNKGRFDEAIAAYRQAIRLKPDYAEAHNNLGNALMDVGQLEEAIASYRQAIRLKPDYAEAHSNLGNALKDMGQLDEAIASYRRAARLKPDYAVPHSNLIYGLHFHPAYDARMIYEEHQRWNHQFADPLRTSVQPHVNDRNPDRRLRIGYVSPDFREHCQSFFTIPLLSNHDREAFEIFCYAHVLRPDAVTERIRGYAQVWRSILRMTDAEAARNIREDRIDILIDLTMHMARGRPLIFVRKPAPVQAAWLAYPGTTGLDAIDYRLTDPYLDPPGLNDQFYSETSIRLPDSFWCYDPLATQVPVNALPAQTHGHITIGCLNNFCKVTEPVLRLWAQVLKTVPRSRFIMLCPEGSRRQPLLDLLQREGISPDRIELVARRPRLQYLDLFHRIDVGLDSFPYNGHTTNLDSFWMGVPVITLVGQTVVGRAGLSQLTNLGLPELIAQTPEQYVQIAAESAGDLPRLAELRRTLRGRMQASPLMDGPRFARNIEAAYRQMWRNWCSRR
jgi:predicted O-linked N-acetylglucosamine transferase (SPINDLY family)